MTRLEPLVELTRNETLENQHFGAVAVCNAQGQLLAHAGDAQWLTFTRSTIKPLQALPFVEAGGPAHFAFGTQQMAMLCASHNGEPQHIAQVDRMLAAAGTTHKALRCGCHVPLFVECGVGPAPADYDERHHNCSGKHAGFLAHCVQQGWPLDDYLVATHPLQQAVRRDVARALGVAADAMVTGTDGCSAPNYAVPLARLAHGFARLASGVRDTEFGSSFALLADAMTAHPDLVSGTHRSDAAFMGIGRGDWVSKVGADAVQVVGSRQRGEAFAIKVIDGNMPALYAATVEVLEQLGWLDDTQRGALAPWRAASLRSARGALVGERRTVIRLRGRSA